VEALLTSSPALVLCSCSQQRRGSENSEGEQPSPSEPQCAPAGNPRLRSLSSPTPELIFIPPVAILPHSSASQGRPAKEGDPPSHSISFNSMPCPCSCPQRRITRQPLSALPGWAIQSPEHPVASAAGKLLRGCTRPTSCQRQTARRAARADPSAGLARTMHTRLPSCCNCTYSLSAPTTFRALEGAAPLERSACLVQGVTLLNIFISRLLKVRPHGRFLLLLLLFISPSPPPPLLLPPQFHVATWTHPRCLHRSGAPPAGPACLFLAGFQATD